MSTTAGADANHGTAQIPPDTPRALWSNRPVVDPALSEIVRRALAAPIDGAEEQAWRNRPYRTPTPWRELEAALGAVVQDAPGDVADRLTVGGILVAPTRFGDAVRQGRARSFRAGHAVVLLLAAGALDVDDVDALAAGDVASGHTLAVWRRQLVLDALAAGDVDAATRAADAIGEHTFMGHRDIGAFHAARGDAPAFFASWSRYHAATERVGMSRLKQQLVRGVAERDGWAAALTVVGDRRMGPKYAAEAFEAWAATGDVHGLFAVFDGDAAGVLAELDELGLLVTALVAAAPRSPDSDVDGLSEVYARLRAIDPSVDKATMRRRDFLLSRLWPAIGEVATLKAVRATIRTPALRSELKRLARDVH